jgi:hypothetical protein
VRSRVEFDRAAAAPPLNAVWRCRGIAVHAMPMPNDGTHTYPSLGIGDGRGSWVPMMRGAGTRDPIARGSTGDERT